jgi:hypothetical protein
MDLRRFSPIGIALWSFFILCGAPKTNQHKNTQIVPIGKYLKAF